MTSYMTQVFYHMKGGREEGREGGKKEEEGSEGRNRCVARERGCYRR